jgi:hypothetical protein
MSLSSVIEVGLGLILVFYLVSTIVTTITNQVSRILNLGADKLVSGLREMLTDKATFDKLYQHPLIDGLSKKEMNLFGGIKVKAVEFIPGQTFALALFDVLVPGAKNNDAQTLDALRAAAANLPAGPSRDSLVTLLNTGVDNLEKAQDRVVDWFNNAMASVSDLYAQHIRQIVLVVAAVVVLLLGIDTVDIATTLWQQPAIRAAAAAEAQTMAQQEPQNPQNAADIQAELDKLGALRIPVLWDFTNLPKTPEGWGLKLLGLIITWIAAVQGAPFWYDVLKKVKPN